MRSRYLKQAWQLLKQNPLFSTIYIAGTGLAIAMTMIIAIVYYIKIAPVYPEVNRPLMMVMKLASVVEQNEEKNVYNSSFGYQAVNDWFYPLKEAEVVSAVYTKGFDFFVQPVNGEEQIPVRVKAVDSAFFRLFEFAFLDGKPFTESDFRSGIRNAVLSQSMARRIFKTEDVVGKTFSLKYTEYKVVGVVKDASYLTPNSFAQLYIPYTCVGSYKRTRESTGLLGSFTVYFKARNAAGTDSISRAVNEIVHKYNNSQKLVKMDVYQQPDIFWKSIFREGHNEIDWTGVVKLYVGILLALLLVPALNLSGMISSRMDGRLAEMGVRKAFGAGRGVLLCQVISENLLLTCLGGVLGLIVAWVSLDLCRGWLFSLFESWPSVIPQGVDPFVSGDMLFSPLIFAVAFSVCVMLNLLSALIPAWRALRKNIVYSLNEKK